MFFQENGCTKHRGGFHQTHGCTYAGTLADAVVQKTFFLGRFFYTSAVAMVMQVHDPAEAGIGWKGVREGKARGLCRRVTGRGPDTKIIRSMHNNPYKWHFI